MQNKHIIKSIDLIDLNTKTIINNFTKTASINNIKGIANFLRENFAIDITTEKDIIKGFSSDWSNMKGNADALCRPKNILECVITIKVCYLLQIPMTISAGRTNLTGSATPQGGIIISINNLNKIKTIDVNNKEITCSPGIYLEELRNHVLQQSNNKLIFPVDPTSRKEAMVGGAISCNASGFTPGEKGAMRYWVNGLNLILPNGEIVSAKKGEYISQGGYFSIKDNNNKETRIKIPTYKRVNIKNASGPYSSENGEMDFIDLIVGSEGIFGCIIESTLNLQDKPSDYLNLFIKLKNEDEAFNLYEDISTYLKNDMGSLSGLEYFGENCSDYMEHKEYLFDEEYNVGVYIQIPIYNENIDLIIEKWHQILIKNTYINKDKQILSLNDTHAWKKFFEARHSMPANALQKAKQYNTPSIITDTIVPPESFNNFIKETHQLIRKENIDYLLFGHLGDCHLHFHLLPDSSLEKKAQDCYHKIIKLSSELGGVYSAEHGTGKRKKQDFIDCYGDQAVLEVKTCKLGFDPNLLLNRGNVFNIE